MNNKIGIMQGRLSKRDPEKLQVFPIKNWKNEFKLCNEIGLDSIEWIIDTNNSLNNPIFSDILVKNIKELSNKHNIEITAVCNDLLMDQPLSDNKNLQIEPSYIALEKLIKKCKFLEISFIELPLIKKSKIRTKHDLNKLIHNLESLKKLSIDCGVTFLLETDLNPNKNFELMKELSGLPVGLNYDTGNSAFWNFDPEEEINLLGKWIKNVHIKDCIPEIYSVPLGNGNVNFDLIMKKLSDINYNGDFILQTAYKINENCIDIIKNYYEFTQKYVKKYFNGIKS